MGSKIQSTGERNNCSAISCSSDFHAFRGTISLTSQEPIWIYTCAKMRQENLTLGVEYQVYKCFCISKNLPIYKGEQLLL